MTGLTARLADFAAHPDALSIDPAVRRTVVNGFTDTVAVMLAGREEPVTVIARRFVADRRSSASEARVLLGAERAASRDAAWVNATAAHALDYDDVGLKGHPSVVLVPALLAESERLRADGASMIHAYVIGYEVWAELVTRDQDLHHLKGWHPTGVFGVVAVAAAVAALRGLDAARAQHALGLAASMAAGLIANFGSMAKPFHAGQAAAQGIDAVNLAEAGMTASPDALEHPAGYLAALSPAGRVDRAPPMAELGRTLRIATLGLTVKKYPMCFATHRVIDATLDLAHAHGLAAQDVEAVDARVGTAQAAMLRNHQPVNSLEAKFSLEFAVAAALVAGRVGLTELHDAFVNRPEVRQLFSRVRIATTSTVCSYEPTLAASDRVVIHMHDGRSFDSGEIPGTRGDAATPLAAHELETKFMDCTAAVEDLDRARLFRSLQQLDRLDNVGEWG
jgi:aconitate decarboxylase